MCIGETLIITCYHLQVGNKGVISFGRPWYFWSPEQFPTRSDSVRSRYVVAPFWSDHDTRVNGSIFYQVHNLTNDQASLLLLEKVSSFITNQTGGNFSGQWMLVVQWDQVHPYPHGASSRNLFSRSYQDFTAMVSVNYFSIVFFISIRSTH